MLPTATANVVAADFGAGRRGGAGMTLPQFRALPLDAPLNKPSQRRYKDEASKKLAVLIDDGLAVQLRATVTIGGQNYPGAYLDQYQLSF
jgi:hypothetical protein